MHTMAMCARRGLVLVVGSAVQLQGWSVVVVVAVVVIVVAVAVVVLVVVLVVVVVSGESWHGGRGSRWEWWSAS